MSETIEKTVLKQRCEEYDKNITQLFALIENEINDKCLKMSTFALFGFRIKLTEEINKIKKLTE